MLKQVNPLSVLKAGFLGTVVMTIIMYSLPLIGLPPMDVMAALGSVFPLKISPYFLGTIVHFGFGIALAIIYAAFFYSWIPGPPWLRGALFSLLPWLFAITLLGPSLLLASKIFGTASSGATNPCAVANPCAPKAKNPCATANPCASKTPANPCAQQTANPCAAKPTNPCAAAAANPCTPAAAFQAGVPPQVLSLIVHLIFSGVLGAFYRPRA